MKLLTQILCALIIPAAAYAGSDRAVSWTGRIFDTPNSHTTTHDHSLSFEEEESKETYDVVDSPVLQKLHHETNRNYKAKIEGYITPKFLFFGGNLVVTKFEILEESEVVALSAPRPRMQREIRGGRN